MDAAMIAEVVQKILDDSYLRDFNRNVESLEPVRREAILYLLSLLDGTTKYDLAPGVDARDAGDRCAWALQSLGEGDIDFIISLLEKELTSDKTQPAFALTSVVAQRSAPRRVDVLMKAIKHKDEFVRSRACEGLHLARARRARPLLNAAAADRASNVRYSAVLALAGLGDTTSLPVLEKRLQDRYPGIRAAAAKAIGAIEKRQRRTPASRKAR
jgi:HEAT repeat protein